MISADLTIVLPEILLSIYAMVALVAAVYTGKDALAGLLTWVTALVFVGLAVWIGMGEGTAQAAFNGLIPGRAYNISVETVSENQV